jgi:hypothetical protein
VTDDLPLNKHSDAEILLAMKIEILGLKKARAALDEASKILGVRPPPDLFANQQSGDSGDARPNHLPLADGFSEKSSGT